MNELIGSETFKAQRADEEFRRELRQHDVGSVRLAIMARNIRDREYYRRIGFEHFNDWMESRIGESRASLYKKMRIVEKLSDLPISTLETLPITNCEILLEVPPSKRLEMAEKARLLPVSEFAALVERVPGNGLQSKEFGIPVTFVLTASQKRIVDKALGKMMSEGDDPPTRRADALEFICQEYLNEV